MLRRFILAAMTLVLATPASAMQSAAPPGPVPPQTAPASSPTASITPPVVAAKKVGGVAKMKCVVNTDGKLSDCVIIFECPVGHGFGEAALKSAPYFKMNAEAAAGKKAIIIPMMWKFVGGDPPPAECLSRAPTSSKP